MEGTAKISPVTVSVYRLWRIVFVVQTHSSRQEVTVL